MRQERQVGVEENFVAVMKGSPVIFITSGYVHEDEETID